jgi:type IV fimbrial biogenesis protein FimT
MPAVVDVTTDMDRSISKSGRKQRGYTLPEVLVTLSILAILGSVAVPGMENIMLDNRRVSVTNDFMRALQLARSEAAARNQRVTVCASANGSGCSAQSYWNSGWIVFNDLNLDGQPGGTNESILMYAQNKDSIELTPDSFTNLVTYRPNGRAMAATVTTNSGEFVFCDRRGADHARVVQIASNGRPTLSHYSTDGSEPDCD